MKRISFFLIVSSLLFNQCGSPVSVTIVSPDEQVSFQLFEKNKQLHFNASYTGKIVIADSPVVFLLDGEELTNEVNGKTSKTYAINEQYYTRGVHRDAVNHCNGINVNFRSAKTKTAFTVEARAYNDGVAFRILVPGGKNAVRTPDEASIFKLPEGSILWYHDLRGHYEGKHVRREISQVTENEWAATPITFRLPDGIGYACITEAALFNYAGMSFQADGQNGLVTRLGHAQPISSPFLHDYSQEEAERFAIAAEITGNITTPWRAVIITPDLNTLVNSDLVSNLAPAPDPALFPKGVDTEWIVPGRSVWCWLDGGVRTPEGMKEFSRIAGELSFEYNVVDAFWYRWTDEQIKDLVDYSAEQGVKVWLWRHGRDVRDPVARKALFERCNRLGVVGLKLDAFSHESKEFIDLYQSCLREAAEHKLMLNIHGSNKPTGEIRTWPHELTREGIYGLEKRNQIWAQHNTTLPFTRFVVGAGDYTPVMFSARRGETTWVHQVATAVVFSSSLMIYGANPESILKNPMVDIIKTLPAEWDETVVLPCSEIGEIAAFARRKGDLWYLGILNGEKAKTLQIPLTFLKGGERYYAHIVSDDPAASDAIKRNEEFCSNTDTFTAQMSDAGGYVVRFTKQ